MPFIGRLQFTVPPREGKRPILTMPVGPPDRTAIGRNLTPVMARLDPKDLETLDALITAGIVSNRADGVRWALARIPERPAYTQLREHIDSGRHLDPGGSRQSLVLECAGGFTVIHRSIEPGGSTAVYDEPHSLRQCRALPESHSGETRGENKCLCAYGHRPTGLTWAMAWVGTVMMPLAVRTLMASAGPLTSGPHQA
jgi:hypothetical protein